MQKSPSSPEPATRSRTPLEKRLYLAVVAVMLLVRGASLIGADAGDVWIRWSGAKSGAAAREQGLVWDQALYDQFGWNLAAEGVLGVGNRPSAFCLPGYPLYLAAVYEVAGHLPGAARWGQVLLSALAVVFLGMLARQLGGPRAEILALFLGAVYPFYVYFVREILTETLFLCGFAATLLAAGRIQARGRVADGLGYGIAATVTAMTRPIGFFLLPGTLILARPWARDGRRRRLIGLALGALILAGGWGSWIARNWGVFGEFVPLDTHGGWSLYMGQLASRGMPPDQAVATIGYHHGDILSGELPGGPLGELAADRNAGRGGWELIRENPSLSLRIFLLNVRDLWLGAYFGDLAETSGLRLGMTLVALLAYLPVLILGMVGLAECWRTGRRELFWAAVILLVTTTVLHGAVQSGKRYRTVTIDPILMTLAAWQASRILARWWPEPPTPLEGLHRRREPGPPGC